MASSEQYLPPDYSLLHHPKALADALSCQVCWARVKGYPYWPAQVLNGGAAQKRLGKIKHTADAVPVMFFGTLEIAWIGQTDIVCFKDGVMQGFLVKGKHKSFLRACGQVFEFLMPDKKRRAPHNWWCRAPNNDLDNGPEDTEPTLPSSSKPTSPHFPRPTSSKASTPHGNLMPSAGNTSGSDVEEEGEEASEMENGSVSEADGQELVCAKPEAKLPPPSKCKALPAGPPRPQGRPPKAVTAAASRGGAGERKASPSCVVQQQQEEEGSSSHEDSGSNSEGEAEGEDEGTGNGKVATEDKNASISAPAKGPASYSQQQGKQANGVQSKEGWAGQAVSMSHLPPKKKLRTAAEAGEPKPGSGSAAAAAAAAKAIAGGEDKENEGGCPDIAMKQEQEPQMPLEPQSHLPQQEASGKEQPKDGGQQQNSESAATTTTTTQLQAPPVFSRQHSCMEMDEDVSASLPAEIRRLAGIKLVKRPPMGSMGGGNSNQQEGSNKKGGRASTMSSLALKTEQAAESSRRSREDAEALTAKGKANAQVHRSASADLEAGCAAVSGLGGLESPGRRGTRLGSASLASSNAAAHSGSIKGLVVCASAPATLGGDSGEEAKEGIEAGAVTDMVMPSTTGKQVAVAGEGGEEAQADEGDGEVKEEEAEEQGEQQPQPQQQQQGHSRRRGSKARRGGSRQEIAAGCEGVAAAAAGAEGPQELLPSQVAVLEQDREVERARKLEREQMLQRKRDRERERRLQLKAQRQRQRELEAIGDANNMSGSELGAVAGSRSNSGSGSDMDSVEADLLEIEGIGHSSAHRANASSRKRRRRHRQARAAAAGLGVSEEELLMVAVGMGELQGGGGGQQGDGAAPMEYEGAGVSGKGLGVESPRRPGARERAREARRRQRNAEALREAQLTQQQQDGGETKEAGVQRVLRDRHGSGVGLSRDRGVGRASRQSEHYQHLASCQQHRIGEGLANGKVGYGYQHGGGSRGELGNGRSRSRRNNEAEKGSQRAVQLAHQQALVAQQQQLVQQRALKQQRREAQAAERAQARAVVREAAMANALRLVAVVCSTEKAPDQTQNHPRSSLPPVLIPPAPLHPGEDRTACVSGHTGGEGSGRPRCSSNSMLESSDYDNELYEDEEEEEDLVMGTPVASGTVSDSSTEYDEQNPPSLALQVPDAPAGPEALASGRRSSRSTTAAAAAAAAATGSRKASAEEELLDAEAAEVLQFMQSMDPEHVVASTHVPDHTTGAGLVTSNGAGIARAPSMQVEAALASLPSPLTQPAAFVVPRAPLHNCQGFVWPDEEPLLPSEPEHFLLPKAWLLARPPRYEHIKRSVWVSRVRPKRITSRDISRCTCRLSYITPDPCQPNIKQALWGCAEGCLNRHSYIHCDPKSCPCGEACSNRPFHLLKGPAMEAFLTDNRGYGVRATEGARRGTFMLEYAGEIIDEAELALRMEAARQAGEPCFYIMDLGCGLYVDARMRGNLARLLNSSCDPNCETQKWHDAATGEPRIGIFATRDIQPGEELTYDYFFQHYGVSAVDTADFICMCGAPNCRGTMDINPGKRKDLGRRIEVHWDGDGVYYRGTVVGYTATSRRHVIMYDDGDKERLCLDTVPHKWLDDEEDDEEDLSIPNGLTSTRKAAAAAAAAAALLPPQGRAWSEMDPPLNGDMLDALNEAAASDLLLQDGSGSGGRRQGIASNGNVADVLPKKRQRSIMGSAAAGGGAAKQQGSGASARGGCNRLRVNQSGGGIGGSSCDMALLLQAVESELTGHLDEEADDKTAVDVDEEGEDMEEDAHMQEVGGLLGAQAPPPPTAAQQRWGRGAARRQQQAAQKELQAQREQQQQAWEECGQQQQQQQQQQHDHVQPQFGGPSVQHSEQQDGQQQYSGSWPHQHGSHNQLGYTLPSERSRLSIIEEVVGIRISSFTLPLFHNQQPSQQSEAEPNKHSSTEPHASLHMPAHPHNHHVHTPASSSQQPCTAHVPCALQPIEAHNNTHTLPAATSLQPSLGGPAAALNALGSSAASTLIGHHPQHSLHHQQQKLHHHVRHQPPPPSPAHIAVLNVLVSSPMLANLASMPGVLSRTSNVSLFQSGPGQKGDANHKWGGHHAHHLQHLVQQQPVHHHALHHLTHCFAQPQHAHN